MPAAAAGPYNRGMVIEVLGLADDRTSALEDALAEALGQLGLGDAVTVRQIRDAGAIIARGVRQPPALRIDGRVVCRRRVPTAGEIRGYLEAAEA
jgi:hypothetical protein